MPFMPPDVYAKHVLFYAAHKSTRDEYPFAAQSRPSTAILSTCPDASAQPDLCP
jgi:hypothetical protein